MDALKLKVHIGIGGVRITEKFSGVSLQNYCDTLDPLTINFTVFLLFPDRRCDACRVVGAKVIVSGEMIVGSKETSGYSVRAGNGVESPTWQAGNAEVPRGTPPPTNAAWEGVGYPTPRNVAWRKIGPLNDSISSLPQLQQLQSQNQQPQLKTEGLEEDVVPETQEEPSRKRKGKGKVNNAQKKAVPWNETEHLALAEA
ncbi:hypothetical protein LXL04_027202 [Taraxacum kok-saghyz]